MPPRGTTHDRLSLLEYEIARLRDDVELAHQRIASAQAPQPIRLAKTCDPSTGSYPTSGIVFPILFMQGSYTKAVNTTSYSTDDRSNDQQDWVCSLGGVLIPVDTEIVVYRIDGYWWTGAQTTTIVEGVLAEDLAQTDDDVDITVGSYVGVDPGTTITADNPESGPGANNIFSGSTGDRCVAALYDDGYHLLLVECS